MISKILLEYKYYNYSQTKIKNSDRHSMNNLKLLNLFKNLTKISYSNINNITT